MNRWMRGAWTWAARKRAQGWTRGSWKWAAGLAVAGAMALGVVARGDDDDAQVWSAIEEGTTAAAGTNATDDARDGSATDGGPLTDDGAVANDDAPSDETSAPEPGASPEMEQDAPPPAARAVGTDAEYVRGVCVALSDFYRDVDGAMLAINPSNPAGIAQELANAFWPILVRFKEDLNQVAPPADLVTWHDTMAAELGHAAERIFAGEGLSEIARLGDHPLPDFPAEAQARLAAAAAATPECRVYEDNF